MGDDLLSRQQILLARRPARRRVLLALGWYAGLLHQGVARYARQAGWILNTAAVRTGSPPDHWRGDGIICILGVRDAIDRMVLGAQVPAVNIGSFIHPAIPRIAPDHWAIGRLAAEHFRSRGFRHFAYCLDPFGQGNRVERCDSFRHHVQGPGTTFDVLDWPGGPRHRKSPRAADLHRWLGHELVKLPKPLALMAEYDDRAIEVLEACADRDIPVPDQVAVMGVDNDPVCCDFAPVPLSSVDDDQEGQGYAAAQLLDRLMRGEPPPREPVLVAPRGIGTRQSTDILAIDHPEVAAALRMIWEHYTEPITAALVAAMVPMSHRCLHDAFVRHVGRSMAGEIARRRVEHACRLLAETNRKTHEIAPLAGFTDAERMCKVFRRLLGTTPAAYRHQARRGLHHSPPANAQAPSGSRA